MDSSNRSTLGTVAAKTLLILALVGLVFSSTSCTSIQPIQKIGLVAPFEGLYRESGYDALDAVRSAITDCAPEGRSIVALALDNSAQTSYTPRTMQKLLQDPALIGVVGPLEYATTVAAAPSMTDAMVPWVAPLAIDAGGEFVDPRLSDAYIDAAVVQMARNAVREGADRVYVLGAPEKWIPGEDVGANSNSRLDLSFATVQLDAMTPANWDSVLGSIGASDAVLWLGQAHTGAEAASRLHEERPDISFWLSPASSIGIFVRHYRANGSIYWVSWSLPEYNDQLQNPASDIAKSQLSYLAACKILSDFDTVNTVEPLRLSLRSYRLMIDGETAIFEPLDTATK